jgi:hypothetical protein
MKQSVKKWYTFSMLSYIALAPLYAYGERTSETETQVLQSLQDKVSLPYASAAYKPLACMYNESSWKKALPEEISKRFSNLPDIKPASSIRELYTCNPTQENSDAKKAVIIVIHGTFAQESDAYRDHRHPEFQHILRFAQYYADKQSTPVEVVSFGWSGQNSSDDRVRAGKELAQLLKNSYSDYDIISIAHSHGCNVANVASQEVDATTPFNYMIQIATPVRDLIDTRFQPKNFNKLLQFYSTSDIVAAVGSLDTRKIFNRPGSMRKYAQQQGRLIYNIRTQIDAKDPGHSTIKGENGVINYLPEILYTLENSYFYNSDLDLNLSSSKALEDPVFLAIRKSSKAEQALERAGIYDFTDTLNSENAQYRVELDPEVRSTLERNPDEQFKYELAYSKAQEERFEKYYNKSIHAKDSLFTRVLSGIALEAAPVMPSIPAKVLGLLSILQQTGRAALNFRFC